MADWVDKYHEMADFLTDGVSMGCRVVPSECLKPDQVALVDFEAVMGADGTFQYVTMVPKKVSDDG